MSQILEILGHPRDSQEGGQGENMHGGQAICIFNQGPC